MASLRKTKDIGMMVDDGAVVLQENSFRLLAHHAGESINRTHDLGSGARSREPNRVRDFDHYLRVLAAFALTGLEGNCSSRMAITLSAFSIHGQGISWSRNLN